MRLSDCRNGNRSGVRWLLREIELPAVARSVRVARARVLSALADTPVDHDAVGLAVTEAVSNAVMHAYRLQPWPGCVRVSVAVADHAIEVVVCDEGMGLTPRPDSPGAGLGIPLMTRLADHIAIDRTAGTRVRLRFALQPTRADLPVTGGRFVRDAALSAHAERSGRLAVPAAAEQAAA